MFKSAVFSAAAAAASIASCQAPVQQEQPQPATRCVVWMQLDEVIPANDPRQAQLDPPILCQLNEIYPGVVDSISCANSGGHTGSLPDTCYDIDY